jgi:hypothetical protein
MSINLRRLRAFVTVAETRSVTLAAQKDRKFNRMSPSIAQFCGC